MSNSTNSKPSNMSYDEWESLGFPDGLSPNAHLITTAHKSSSDPDNPTPGDLAREQPVQIDISVGPESRPNNQGIFVYFPTNELPNNQGVKRILYERQPGQTIRTGWVMFECKCGNIFWDKDKSFHKVLNCGCMPPIGKPDLTGRRFGKLTALRFQRGMGWECRCDCGNLRWVGYGQLDKLIRSCGECKRTGSRPASELMQVPKPILDRLRYLKAATGRPMTQLLEEAAMYGFENNHELRDVLINFEES